MYYLHNAHLRLVHCQCGTGSAFEDSSSSTTRIRMDALTPSHFSLDLIFPSSTPAGAEDLGTGRRRHSSRTGRLRCTVRTSSTPWRRSELDFPPGRVCRMFASGDRKTWESTQSLSSWVLAQALATSGPLHPPIDGRVVRFPGLRDVASATACFLVWSTGRVGWVGERGWYCQYLKLPGRYTNSKLGEARWLCNRQQACPGQATPDGP